MAGLSPLEISGRAHPAPGVWILHFSWPTNPLPMNGSRGNSWRTHARKVRAVKNQASQLATFSQIPAAEHVTAQLTWWVTDRRIRDPDNLAQLEKPLFDALVTAGIVPDDRPELMTKPRALIRQVADSDGLVTTTGFTLTITT